MKIIAGSFPGKHTDLFSSLVPPPQPAAAPPSRVTPLLSVTVLGRAAPPHTGINKKRGK